jgi:hypothetical protein
MQTTSNNPSSARPIFEIMTEIVSMTGHIQFLDSQSLNAELLWKRKLCAQRLNQLSAELGEFAQGQIDLTDAVQGIKAARS